MSDRQVADDLGQAVAEVLSKHGQMATRWVVLVEVIEGDGNRGLWIEAPEDMRQWETLGLLEFARAHECAKMTNDYRGED